mmetsp:Transcript_56834/g.144065  ORF Transcript_56834/g.144065 Transcript_56834/m.144065 type:complete len:224 (+) Transcript_56834:388-1059(+)
MSLPNHGLRQASPDHRPEHSSPQYLRLCRGMPFEAHVLRIVPTPRSCSALHLERSPHPRPHSHLGLRRRELQAHPYLEPSSQPFPTPSLERSVGPSDRQYPVLRPGPQTLVKDRRSPRSPQTSACSRAVKLLAAERRACLKFHTGIPWRQHTAHKAQSHAKHHSPFHAGSDSKHDHYRCWTSPLSQPNARHRVLAKCHAPLPGALSCTLLSQCSGCCRAGCTA